MRKEINVKFASVPDDLGWGITYWEKIILDLDEDANMAEVCEAIYHHDFWVVSMVDMDAEVIDVQWQ